MSKLKPCPFCGGEAETHNPFGDVPGMWHAFCVECTAATSFAETADDAIEVWNARYEQTCRWEKTARETDFDHWLTECGESFIWTSGEMPKCCPNCGAHVEERN